MTTTGVHTQATSHLTKGYLICVAGTVFLSTTAIFIRYLSENYHITPLALAFWRDLFASAALFLFVSLPGLRKSQRGLSISLKKADLVFVIFYGFELSLFNTLWTMSVYLNGAAVSTVLAYSSAAFTALLGWRILREPLGPAKALAVLLSLLGCVFVSGAFNRAAWQGNALGILTGLIAGLAYAVYTLLGRSASHRKMNPWVTLAYTFFFASVFLLGYNLVSAWLTGSQPVSMLIFWGGDLAGWLALALLAVGPTISGFGLYMVSLSYLPASVANLIATLEPALTAMMAYLLLSERLTVPQITGSALIIAGVLVLRLMD
jgi:drug/metabolite transporter (DMT)-like permease